jgi:GNAT superfamily N-acetyltransferase
MWTGYCAYYQVAIPPATTVATWRRIIDPASAVKAVVAIDRAGVARGFANYVLHPYTWGEGPVCYLEDLFVVPDARGNGMGRRLIEHLVEAGRQQGWERLYWMTRSDNAAARNLYNAFCESDGFVRYLLPLNAR